MNNEIKIEKYYSSAKMYRALMLMEQFHMLSICNDKDFTEKDRICAKKLFEHYRRLAMCILMKDMPEIFENELVLDKQYMLNMYKKYTE